MTEYTDSKKEREYERQVRQEILDWENRPLTGLQKASAKITDGVMQAGKVAGKLVPAPLSNALTQAIETTLTGFASAMKATVNPEGIERQVKEKWSGLDCCCELQARDEVARKSKRMHISAATAEGAAIGVGGIATTLVDIPAFTALTLRSLADIAVSYGYDPRKEDEQAYLMATFAMLFAVEGKAKHDAMLTLKALEKEFKRGTWKGANDILARIFGKNIDLREIAKRVGIVLTKKQAARMVPVVGAVVGGTMNGVMMNQATETAFMVYRRRWLEDHRSLPTVDASD